MKTESKTSSVCVLRSVLTSSRPLDHKTQSSTLNWMHTKHKNGLTSMFKCIFNLCIVLRISFFLQNNRAMKHTWYIKTNPLEWGSAVYTHCCEITYVMMLSHIHRYVAIHAKREKGGDVKTLNKCYSLRQGEIQAHAGSASFNVWTLQQRPLQYAWCSVADVTAAPKLTIVLRWVCLCVFLSHSNQNLWKTLSKPILCGTHNKTVKWGKSWKILNLTLWFVNEHCEFYNSIMYSSWDLNEWMNHIVCFVLGSVLVELLSQRLTVTAIVTVIITLIQFRRIMNSLQEIDPLLLLYKTNPINKHTKKTDWAQNSVAANSVTRCMFDITPTKYHLLINCQSTAGK